MFPESTHLAMPLREKPSMQHLSFTCKDGPKKESYHIDFWTLHLYRYAGSVIQDGQFLPVSFGSIGFNPPGSSLIYDFGEETCPYLCATFRFASTPDEPLLYLPKMVQLGPHYQSINQRLEEMILIAQVQQFRAEIKLWDLLHDLADLFAPKKQEVRLPAPVQRTIRQIEQSLNEPLCPASLARLAECSHTHLNRLFNQSLKLSVGQYILKRRMENAKYLLQTSELSIKEIAHECGIPDPQQFNKKVRKYYGESPSKLREQLQKQ